MTGERTAERADTISRLTALTGPGAVVASFVAIFGSVALASGMTGDWFTWTGHALSHLGERGRATAPLFNYGLVVAGLLGVAFAWRVWSAGTNVGHRMGAALAGLGLLNAALVGVFPLPHDLHAPVAVAFFVLATFGLFVHGGGDALAGRTRRGVVTVGFATAHAVAWALLPVVPFGGIALPELVGVLALWVWTLAVYAGLG